MLAGHCLLLLSGEFVQQVVGWQPDFTNVFSNNDGVLLGFRERLGPTPFVNDGGGLMRGGSVEVLGFGEELMIKIALYSKSSHNVVDRFCDFKQNDI